MGEERDRAHVNESKPGVITMLFSKKRPHIFFFLENFHTGFPKNKNKNKKNIASVDLQ